MPNASSRTFATGARQFVVHEAFETMRCSGFNVSWLTPITIIASISSFAGTVSSTLRAPASMCFWQPSPVNRVVLQEVRERRRIGDVVDRHDLHVVALVDDPEHVAADAAEAVDGDAHCHEESFALVGVEPAVQRCGARSRRSFGSGLRDFEPGSPALRSRRSRRPAGTQEVGFSISAASRGCPRAAEFSGETGREITRACRWDQRAERSNREQHGERSAPRRCSVRKLARGDILSLEAGRDRRARSSQGQEEARAWGTRTDRIEVGRDRSRN
jgi:hypothetical protein